MGKGEDARKEAEKRCNGRRAEDVNKGEYNRRKGWVKGRARSENRT